MDEYEVMIEGAESSWTYIAPSPELAAREFLHDNDVRDGDRLWVGEPGTYEDQGSGTMYTVETRTEYDLVPS